MSTWPRRVTVPALPAGRIHFWRADLDGMRGAVGGYRMLLSGDELERAARFRFEHDRDRFVVCRGVLRRLLAGYQGLADPREIVLTYGAHGKPALADAADRDLHLRFNVSHAAGLALFAFTRSAEVGVDVERAQRFPDLEGLMRSYFAPGERRTIAALRSGGARQRAFFRCWTRKEAVLKATGMGLALALDAFEVSLAATGPVRLRWRTKAAHAAAPWRLISLSPGAGFAGAAAWVGPPLARSCWSYALPHDTWGRTL